MQIPRFFLTPNEVGSLSRNGQATQPSSDTLDFRPDDELQLIGPALTNQLKNVLRLRVGDLFDLLDNRGHLYRATISKIADKHITCTIIDSQTAGGDPPVKVVVALPLLKGDRFDWALQKLTELGVHMVVPVVTTRSVVKADTSGDARGSQAKLVRWQSILKEAAEQCERATIPYIVPPQKFSDYVAGAIAGGTNFLTMICAERVAAVSPIDILLDHGGTKSDLSATTDKTIVILIGPEGGFTEDEILHAQNAGAVPVSLGPRILRAETAAIYSLAQVIWCLEK